MSTPRPAWELWFPPLDPPVEGGLPRDVAEDLAASWWECDPHLAAALAWETYAAMSPLEPSVRSVQTGVQAVTYESPGGRWAMAMARAAWHRSMAGGFGSVPLELAPVGEARELPVNWWQVNAEHPW